ncbi:MAG TPA: endonuclease [Nocardioidaceae bacterium]|nr:endonuclease [Nocardioidaceae bacterium]
MPTQKVIARTLLDRQGTSYAERAGIRLKDTPSPLYRLLVLSLLLSARISADIAVAAAKELSKAGYRTPKAMTAATWQDRVDALGRGHYRRYDERTATMLGDGAEQLLDEYGGDLRRLRESAVDQDELEERLQRFPGIGPAGAAIFCREVQAVWTDLWPYVDAKAEKGAKAIGLPSSARRLARLVDRPDLPRLLAGCIDVANSRRAADEVRAAAR